MISHLHLVLNNGEEFDVTMFADMMNDSFKDVIVEKINHYLNIAHKYGLFAIFSSHLSAHGV